jgi:hypothetical protein
MSFTEQNNWFSLIKSAMNNYNTSNIVEYMKELIYWFYSSGISKIEKTKTE